MDNQKLLIIQTILGSIIFYIAFWELNTIITLEYENLNALNRWVYLFVFIKINLHFINIYLSVKEPKEKNKFILNFNSTINSIIFLILNYLYIFKFDLLETPLNKILYVENKLFILCISLFVLTIVAVFCYFVIIFTIKWILNFINKKTIIKADVMFEQPNFVSNLQREENNVLTNNMTNNPVAIPIEIPIGVPLDEIDNFNFNFNFQ
jgi:hypothetical protein